MATNEINTGFTAYENEFIHNNNLSDGAYRLATILSTFRFQNKNGTFNECIASQSLLSRIMKRSVRSIQRYLRELKTKGYINIIRRGSTSNKYEFIKEIKRYIDASIKQAKEKANAHVEYLRQTYGYKKANKSKNKGNWNNYEQRTYDFDDLERKLLGWDKLE